MRGYLQPWRVGALLPPGADAPRGGTLQSVNAAASEAFHADVPSPSAGISAVSNVAQSGFAGQLSDAGKLVVSATELAANKLAGGDPTAAATIAAVALVTTTSYAMGQSLINKGLDYVSEAVGGVSAAVPIIGAIVNIIIKAAQYPAGSYSPEEIDSKCRLYYSRVVTGNGGNLTGTPAGTILPADLFMAGAQNPNTGDTSTDVFGWKPGLTGDKSPPDARRGGSLANLLRLLEEDIEQPSSASAKAAKIAWPNAGLSPELRIYLKQLRLGMSAGYVNSSIPRLYTPELTDGGTTYWPVYADLLTSEFRWGAPGIAPGSDRARIPKDWLRWRYLHRTAAQSGDADKLEGDYAGMPTPALVFANAMAARAQGSKTTAAKNPLKAVADFIFAEDDNFTLAFGNCAVFDFRQWDDFYALVDGWYKGVYAPSPTYEFPDSVGQSGMPSWGGVATAALFFAALAAGAYYVADPKAALRTAKSLPTLARRLPKQALSSAQGAGRWALGGARSVSKRLAGGAGG